MRCRGRVLFGAGLVLPVALGVVRAQDSPVPPPVDPDLGESKKPLTPDPGVAPVSTAAAAARAGGTAPVSSATPGKAAELPDVLVTAPTGTEERLFDATVGINVISRQKLDEEQPRYLSDALRYQSGLWFSQGENGQAGTPIIRGLQGAQILMLVDGVRLTNIPGGDSGPGSDFDAIDTTNLDHLEVLRSPDSVLFGSQAIGGVIAAYTRIPIENPTEGFVYGGRNTFSYASSDFTRRDRVDVYGATPSVRLQLGFTYLNADDLHAGNGGGLQAPTAHMLAGGEFHLEWKPTAAQTIGLWFNETHKEWDGNFLDPSQGIHTTLDRKIFSLWWRNEAPTVAYDKLEANLSFLRYERTDADSPDLDNVDKVVQTPQIELRLHKRVFESHGLLYGIHLHLDDTDWQETTSAGTTRPVPSGWFGDLGVFAQDEWDVLPTLRVTGGVRVDGVHARTYPRRATTDPLFNVSDLEVSQSDWALTGKVGVLYHAIDELNLTANFSRGYRFPALADLAGFNLQPDGVTVGNPKLQPEWSNNFEIGARTQSEWFRGSITGFATFYDHLIVTQYGTLDGKNFLDRNGNGVVDPANELIEIEKNAGTANSQGVELDGDLRIHPVEWLPKADLYGNFTWFILTTHPRDTADVRGSPTNGTLGIRLAEPKDGTWWVAFESHMVAHFTRMPDVLYQQRQDYRVNPQDPSSPTLRNRTFVPGYTVFDVRGGYKFCEHATLDLGIENLLNRNYRPLQSRHDAPGITFLAALTVSF